MAIVSVKVITINTWKGDGEYAARMNLLADELLLLKPQLIVCQECFATEDQSVSTVGFLADALGMHAAFTRARFKPRKFSNQEVNSYSGLGILSSFPVQVVKEMDLPSSIKDGGRKAQFACISICENVKILVVNLHLTHLQNDTSLRLKQVDAIIHEVLEHSEYTQIVICGDFNATHETMEMQLFFRYLNAMDCYALGQGRKPAINEDTRNTFQIGKVVDHILVLPNKQGSYPGCSDSSLVLYTPDSKTGIYPSDHPGIATTLHFYINS